MGLWQSRFALGAITAISACAIIPSSAGAADDALIAAAKKEGSVVWYTPLIVDQAARPFAATFEKKYPGVKVQIVGGQANDLFLKLMNEGKAGTVHADVSASNATLISSMIKANIIEKYVPDSAADYPPDFKDPNGYFIAVEDTFLVPVANTDLVKPADIPKSWDDFLDPKWKGKIAWPGTNLPSGPPGFIGTTLLTMGEQKGMDYLKKLAAQQIINVAGNQRVVLDNVIAGEYPLALMIFNHLAAYSAQKGAPVQWLKINPAVVQLSQGILLKNAPHPNAGKLFIDYWTSHEGQSALAAINDLPADPKVPAKIPDLKPENGGFKAFNIPQDTYEASQDKWIKIYKDLFL